MSRNSTEIQRVYINPYWDSISLGEEMSRNITDVQEELGLTEQQEPEQLWSSPRTRTLYIEDYYKEQLLSRYAMLTRPTSGLSNVVIDSFVPKLMYSTNLRLEYMREQANFPSTSVAISPWFADQFGVKQITTEQMCRILGYSLKDIKKLLTAVKARNYSISFAGYGGTGVNTIHWLTEMSKMTHTIGLFKDITIYEEESAEASNLLRFPKHPLKASPIANNRWRYDNSVPRNSHKLCLVSQDEMNILCKGKYVLHDYYLTKDSNLFRRDYNYVNRVYSDYYLPENHIIYGAPSLEARQQFSEVGSFISATHANNTCSLHLNPTQDTDIQTESYGVIQLAPFFMNQLRMAIGLLETLAVPRDWKEKNVELLDFTFTGESLLSTDRKYNFQIDSSTLLTTPEAAQEEF